MTCADFEKILPDVVEGVRSIDQESHLKSCPSCLDLVADLELIFREARQLEGLYEPSPRVWNSIEATLRQRASFSAQAGAGAPVSEVLGVRVDNGPGRRGNSVGSRPLLSASKPPPDRHP